MAKVVLFEDKVQLMEQGLRSLRMAGHEVVRAAFTLDQALETVPKLPSLEAQVVILDANLAKDKVDGSDGRQVAAAIRALGSGIKILEWSAERYGFGDCSVKKGEKDYHFAALLDGVEILLNPPATGQQSVASARMLARRLIDEDNNEFGQPHFIHGQSKIFAISSWPLPLRTDEHKPTVHLIIQTSKGSLFAMPFRPPDGARKAADSIAEVVVHDDQIVVRLRGTEDTIQYPLASMLRE